MPSFFKWPNTLSWISCRSFHMLFKSICIIALFTYTHTHTYSCMQTHTHNHFVCINCISYTSGSLNERVQKRLSVNLMISLLLFLICTLLWELWSIVDSFECMFAGFIERILKHSIIVIFFCSLQLFILHSHMQARSHTHTFIFFMKK